MAGTLSRVTAFVAATPILSSEVNAELNQLVNLLNSTSSNIKLSVKVSDAGDAPIEANQLSTGPIQKWFQAGVEKAKVGNTGTIETASQFKSTLATGTKPVDVTSTTLCTNLNADLVDGIDGANIAKLDTHLVKLKEVWYIRDPIANLVDQTTQHIFIAPAGTGMRITKLSLIRRSGGHAAGDLLTWRLNRNGSAVGSGVSFSDTNSAANTEYSETLNQTMSSGDRIQLDNIALPASASELDVSIMMEWEQRLT